MKMFVGGRWQGSPAEIDVVAPYSGSVVDRIPLATAAQVEEALSTAQRGAAIMRGLPGATRAEVLRRAAEAGVETIINIGTQPSTNAEVLAQVITLPGAKT